MRSVRPSRGRFPGGPMLRGRKYEASSLMSSRSFWSRQSREVQGMLLSLMSAACMGITYVASKHVLKTINPETFVVFWFAMGSFYSLLLLTKRGRHHELFRRENPWKQLLGLGLAS